MLEEIPESLGIIAGKGVYPRVFAASARERGVSRLFALAMKKETDPVIERYVDETTWVKVGQLQALLDAFRRSGVRQAVMVGQVTPTMLFRARPDRAMRELLSRLKVRNAETIFGAIADELNAIGIELAPASLFMDSQMPAVGVLSQRQPTETEREDIELGIRVAKATAALEIGQTVVIKEGTILAVEAFEGTDETIQRAGRLGGPGSVVVKVAKRGHDMRFDIPVIGERTLKTLKRAHAAVLAVEAGRTILLEKDKIIDGVDSQGLCLVAVQLD